MVFTGLYSNYLSESLAAPTSIQPLLNMKFLAHSIDSSLESFNYLIRWAQGNTTIGKYIQTPDNDSYRITALPYFAGLYDASADRLSDLWRTQFFMDRSLRRWKGFRLQNI